MTESVERGELALSVRDRLILDHLPLLHFIVGRLAIEMPSSIQRDDLLSFGMVGLISAADAWDESRGLRFSTFAFPRIRGAILDELRRMDFLPRGRRDRVKALDRALSELEQQNGCTPTPEELATALGQPLEEIDEILQHARVAGMVSLDEVASEELGSLVSDPHSVDPVGTVAWDETKELLVVAIGELPEQERTVITLYYGEELLLREIAEVLEVTESRVSQIHTRALFRLNRAMRAALDAA